MATLNDIVTSITKTTAFTQENDLNPNGADTPLVANFIAETPAGDFLDLWITDMEQDAPGQVENVSVELMREDDVLERATIGFDGFGSDSLPTIVADAAAQWYADYTEEPTMTIIITAEKNGFTHEATGESLEELRKLLIDEALDAGKIIDDWQDQVQAVYPLDDSELDEDEAPLTPRPLTDDLLEALACRVWDVPTVWWQRVAQ